MKNTNENTFNFRSKFTKIIGSDVEFEVYQKAFEKFCDLQAENAMHILWSLTYDKETDALDDIGLFDGNSPENFIILRNELRHQYEKLHPEFLKLDVPEECQEAFTLLKNRADIIVATVVFQHCNRSVMYSDVHSRDRVIFLLESPKENLQFGGLRSLNFTQPAAEYLLQFCAEIHALFKALNDAEHQREKNTPFAGLGALIEDSGMDLPFDFGSIPDKEQTTKQEVVVPAESESEAAQPDQPGTNSHGFRRLYAEAVSMYKDAFASFVKDDNMNALLEIGKLGFDLNEVMAKKEKIYNLISALQEKESAEFLLSLATKDLNG